MSITLRDPKVDWRAFRCKSVWLYSSFASVILLTHTSTYIDIDSEHIRELGAMQYNESRTWNERTNTHAGICRSNLILEKLSSCFLCRQKIDSNNIKKIKPLDEMSTIDIRIYDRHVLETNKRHSSILSIIEPHFNRPFCHGMSQNIGKSVVHYSIAVACY